MPVFNKRFGRVGWFRHGLARLYAWLSGWRVVGELPDDPRMIGILAPHTSNWDVFYMYLMAENFRIKANWLAKDSLLRPPWGWFLRPLGAIPVVRSEHHNMTDAVAETILAYDRLYLAIAPEGTRRRVDTWRTGFYHIARKAGVRVILMYIDYRKKEVGFGPIIDPANGGIQRDFETIRAFYAGVTPKHPENWGGVPDPEARKGGD